MTEAVIAAATAQYCIRRISLAEATEITVAEWRELVSRYDLDVPLQDPEWLRGYFEGQLDNLFLYLLYDGNRLCGIAPFLRRDWPLKWHFGEWAIAEFPLTRLRLLGSLPMIPEQEAAYDALFCELTANTSGYNTLYFDDIPVDSFFWRYLHTNGRIAASFQRYMPDAPLPRPILRFEGTFEQYMAKFSPKHRKNLNRAVKKVREGELGPMRFVRYDSPGQIEEFLRYGVEISRQTYQWNLHQRGLYATDLVRRRLTFAAGRGWMRCYILFCGDKPCAYAVGLQYRGRFMLEDIGFDPSLAKHSVGTVLQLLMVEDLFSCNCPRIFDLGEYGGYKDVLSTENYPEGRMFLFRKGAYSKLITAGHYCSAAVTKKISGLLERYNLKSKIRQVARGWRS